MPEDTQPPQVRIRTLRNRKHLVGRVGLRRGCEGTWVLWGFRDTVTGAPVLSVSVMAFLSLRTIDAADITRRRRPDPEV